MANVPANLPRLFVAMDLAGASIAIDAAEAHYLEHVRRLGVGDALVVFDGEGTERVARVAALRRRGAELALEERLAPLPESELAITLVQALVKNDAADLIVQKATELGVAAIRMVRTEFSVVRLDAARAAQRVGHWSKIARAACEQSRRHRVPAITSHDSLAACLDDLPRAELAIALHPGAAAGMRDLPALATREARIAIGPEGGFGAVDLACLTDRGFRIARLGPRVLRAETAALTACAWVASRFGDLG